MKSIPQGTPVLITNINPAEYANWVRPASVLNKYINQKGIIVISDNISQVVLFNDGTFDSFHFNSLIVLDKNGNLDNITNV